MAGKGILSKRIGHEVSVKKSVSSTLARTLPGVVGDRFRGKKIGLFSGSDKPFGVFTGSFYKDDQEKFFVEVTFFDPIKSHKAGWVPFADVNVVKPTKELKDLGGEELIQDLAANNTTISKRLLIMRELMERLDKKGVEIPEKLVSTFITLTNRLQERADKMKESKLLSIKEVLDDSYYWLKEKFGFAGVPQSGVGFLPALPAIPWVAAGVGGLAVAGLLYYVFVPDYEDSEKDLEVSEKLQKALQNVDPETRKEILEDLEEQVDDAYNAGKRHQWFESAGTLIKYGALATGVIVILVKAPAIIDQLTRQYKRA